MSSLIADEDEFSNKTLFDKVRGVLVPSLWDAAPVSCLSTEASGPADGGWVVNV